MPRNDWRYFWLTTPEQRKADREAEQRNAEWQRKANILAYEKQKREQAEAARRESPEGLREQLEQGRTNGTMSLDEQLRLQWRLMDMDMTRQALEARKKK